MAKSPYPEGLFRESPFLKDFDLGLSRSRFKRVSVGNDFWEDPLRAGDPNSERRAYDPTYQTTGAFDGRRGSEVANNAKRLLESLPSDAPEETRRRLQEIVGAGFEPEETKQGKVGKFFNAALQAIDAPRKIVALTAADAFGIGPEFSAIEGIRQVVRMAPSPTPAGVLPKEFKNEDGQLTVSGTDLLKAAGWNSDTDTKGFFETVKSLAPGGVPADWGAVGSRWQRGVSGFALDMALDPLNWVTFGSWGLGKAAVTAAVKSGVASGFREAAEAGAKGLLGQLTDPMSIRAGKELLEGGAGARAAALERATKEAAESLGRSLDPTELDVITRDVEEAWWKMRANESQVVIGLDPPYDDALAGVAPGVAKLLEGQGSPMQAIFDKASELAADKKFHSLADLLGDAIDSKYIPSYATGGLGITVPFGRKKVPGLSLGMRTDRLASAPVRKVLEEVGRLVPPTKKIRMTLDDWKIRSGWEAAELGSDRAGQAWSVGLAQGQARADLKALGVEMAPHQLSASLRNVSKAADEAGVSHEEAYDILARMFDQGAAEGVMQHLVSSPALRQALEEGHHVSKVTMEALHEALKAEDPGLGHIDDYLPMVPTKQFEQLVGQLAAKGTKLDFSDLTSKEEKFGMTLLSEYVAAQASKAARGSGQAMADRSRHMNARLLGKSLFVPFDGVTSGLSKSEIARQLYGEGGPTGGWAYRGEVNSAINKAIDVLKRRGAIDAKLPSLDPFSMDLPEVLNSYVVAMSKVLHFRSLVRHGKRLGLVRGTDEALDIGVTMAEIAATGPLSTASKATLRSLRAYANGDTRVSVSSRPVRVVEGWNVDLPAQIADDPRVVDAFKNLTKQAKKAVDAGQRHVGELDAEVRKLVDLGLPESMARQAVIRTSDKALRDAQAALFASLADESARLKSFAEEISLGSPEERARGLQAAFNLQRQWEKQARSTLADMREQWASQFKWTDVESDEAVDLLNPDITRTLSDLIDRQIEAELVARIGPEKMRSIEAAQGPTSGDMRLSLLRAAENAGYDVETEGIRQLARTLQDLVVVSNVQAADLVEEVGPMRALDLLQKMAGYVQPDVENTWLRGVADDLMRNRTFGKRDLVYVPRAIDDPGNVKEIVNEYRSLVDQDVEAAAQFGNLVQETFDQISVLEREGFEFVPWTGDGQPYASMADALQDVHSTHRILVPTMSDTSEAAMFWDPSLGMDGMPFGNLFDALHTVLGHGIHGFGEDARGITEAWLAHGQMYTDDAREAFTALTRGRRLASLEGPAPRKVALMDDAVSAFRVKNANTSAEKFVGKMATRDFKRATHLAKSVEDLQKRLSKLQASRIVNVTEVPGVERTAGDPFFARAILSSGEVKEFKTEQAFEAWKATQAREIGEIQGKYDRMLADLVGQPAPRVRAAKPDYAAFTPESADQAMREDMADLFNFADALDVWRRQIESVELGDLRAADEGLKVWRDALKGVDDISKDFDMNRDGLSAASLIPDASPPIAPEMRILDAQQVAEFPFVGEAEEWVQRVTQQIRFQLGESTPYSSAETGYIKTMTEQFSDPANLEGLDESLRKTVLRSEGGGDRLEGAVYEFGQKGKKARPPGVVGRSAGEGNRAVEKFFPNQQAVDDYVEGLRTQWKSAHRLLQTLTADLAEELKKIDLPDLVEGADPIGLQSMRWDHPWFSGDDYAGLWGAALKKGGQGSDARSFINSQKQATMDLADSTGLRSLEVDAGYDVLRTTDEGVGDPRTAERINARVMAPSTGALAALRAADPHMIAANENDIRELFDMIGLDPRALQIDPLRDGQYAVRYLTGPLTTADRILPPEKLRSTLRPWVPFDTAHMTTGEIVSKVYELVETGALKVDQFPREIAEFLKRVPDGRLPFEAEVFEDLARRAAEMRLSSSKIRRQIPSSVKPSDASRAAQQMGEILAQVEPFLQRKAGDVARLDELWDAARPLLERALPPKQFAELMSLVEIAPAFRTATAKARMSSAGNAARTWHPVGEALESFDRAKSEALQALAPVVNPDKALAMIETMERFEEHLFNMSMTWGRSSQRAVRGLGEFEQAIPETDIERVADFTTALEKLNLQAKGIGGQLEHLAYDSAFTEYMARHLDGMIPEGRTPQEWLIERAKALKEPVQPARLAVQMQGGFVNPSKVDVAGMVLTDQLVERHFAVMLESLAAHISASYSPLGLRMMKEQLDGWQRWWKASTTVARPTFVPRNVMGGMFNNLAGGAGPVDMAWVGNTGVKIRRRMSKGMLFEDALEDVGLSESDKMVWRAAQDRKIFDTEFASDIADPLTGQTKRSVNPFAGMLGGDKTFVGFDVGGKFMQSSEDFLRMSLFHRWYDPAVPESAVIAKKMVDTLHFDYANLTTLESNIKKFAPFYVWTRRNIPLQMRLMLERPGLMNRWQSIQRNAESAYADGERDFADQQPTPSWMGGSSVDLDTVIDRGDGNWMRIMFSPDLPPKDLEQLVRRFSSGNPASATLGFIGDAISPLFSLPLEQALADPESSDALVYAPTGFAEVLRLMDKVGLWWGEEKGGQPLVTRGTRGVMETGVPFLREWTEIAGVAPSDPERAADIGYRVDDGVSLAERFTGVAMGLGKAVGIRGTTPHDSLQPIKQASDTVKDLEAEMIREGYLPPEGATGAPREQWFAPQQLATTTGGKVQTGRIAVDGDTFWLQHPDGTREEIRLIGVNTPEKGQLGSSMAAQFLQNALDSGGKVTMVSDVVDKDQFGRLLRYVWVGDRLLNLELVERGYAHSAPYTPNRAFEKVLNG